MGRRGEAIRPFVGGDFDGHRCRSAHRLRLGLELRAGSDRTGGCLLDSNYLSVEVWLVAFVYDAVEYLFYRPADTDLTLDVYHGQASAHLILLVQVAG